MKYPEKVARLPDPNVRYPDEVERRPDRMAAARYPEKVGCRSGRIPDVRYPGGVSDDFRPGGMSYATCRKGYRLCVQGRESHVALFSEDPTMPPFISPVWPSQKRRDKNVTFTKFLFHW